MNPLYISILLIVAIIILVIVVYKVGKRYLNKSFEEMKKQEAGGIVARER